MKRPYDCKYPDTRPCQAIHLRCVLQEVLTQPIPERAYLYPHRSEAIQVPILGMHQGLQTSRQALSSQEASREQDLPYPEGQEEINTCSMLWLSHIVRVKQSLKG